MSLSAAEQQELSQLEGDVGHVSPHPSLSGDEQSELSQLEKEVGHVATPQKAAQSAQPKTPDEIMAANAKRVTESGDAFNNSLLDQLAMGHLPQIKAKLGQMFSGEGISNDNIYVNRRDAAIASQQDLAERYPVENIQGKVAGFVAPMLATGGGSALEEAPAAAQVVKQGLAKALAKGAAKGAAVGGTMGMAQNPGDTAGVVDPLQIGQRVDNAKTGALVGAAIGAPLNAVPNAAEYLSGSAEKKALKGAGAMLKDFRKAYATDSIEDTGRFILDHKLVAPGDTYESTAAKALALRDSAGKELGKHYDSATEAIEKIGPEAKEKVEAAGFNPVRDKQMILDSAKKELGYSYGRKNALNGLSSYLDELISEHGDRVLNPSETNGIKTALDQSAINYERNPLLKEPDAETALKSFRGALSKKVSGQIQAVGDATGDKEAAQRLADLNSRYGMASKVSRMAGDKSQRDAANAAFGLKEYAGAEIGGELGEAIGGKPGRIVGTVAGGAIGHVGRKLGPSLSASATDAAANALEKTGNPSLWRQASPAVYGAVASRDNSGDFEAPPGSRQDVSPAKSQPSPPLKGPVAWANTGLNNLIDHSGDKSLADQKEALMSNPKAKNLLIAASDLKPGSKAMEQILSKLKSHLDEEK